MATDPQWGFGRDTIEGCIRYMEATDRRIQPTLLCKDHLYPDCTTEPFDAFLLAGRSPWIVPYISGQPVVHLDLTDPVSGEYSVSTNANDIGWLAADILWNRGTASFGYCTYAAVPHTDLGRRSEARRKAFVHGLAEHGVPHADTCVSPHTLESPQGLLRWVDSLPRPAGIFAFNDTAALEVLQACNLLRLQVPHDVAVVGVDNDQLICNLSHPSITSIDINQTTLAYQGLAMVEQILTGNLPAKRNIRVPVTATVLRESTGHFTTSVDTRLNRAITYIRERAHQNPSVDALVRASGLSHRNLELLFKEQQGRTPQEELILARHTYCLKELRIRHASIEEISAHLGMNNSTFYRTFKKIEGCTPAEYRNYYRGSAAPLREMNRIKTEPLQIGILSSFHWQASRDFMNGVTAYAQTDPGINLILHDYSRFTPSAEQHAYDGAIVVSGDHFPKKSQATMPVVFHAYEQHADETGCRRVDEIDIGRLAGRHFIRKGHRHFAYFTPYEIKQPTPNERAFTLRDQRGLKRKEGLRAALDDAGLQDAPIHTFVMESAKVTLLEWLQSLPKPIALFCFNDQLAAQIQQICQHHNINVPKQIAILGVDNHSGYCKLAQPSLSSIDIGFARIGAHTLKQLVAYLRKKPSIETRAFQAQMVHARGSTAGLAVDDSALCSAVEYIETHFQEPISVNEIAMAAGINRRPLEMRFKKYLRSTPRHYLQETRLIHAEKLLIYSSQRINEISDQCGFKQTNHFCRLFREQYGVTPREFRVQRGALEYNPITRTG